MIAHERTVEEIADELGADSLAYLSIEGVYEAIGTAARGPLRRLLHRRLPARRPRARRTASSRSRTTRRRPRRALAPSRGEPASASPSSPRARAPTCRRSSTGCTAATGSRSSGSAPTSPARGRWSGRAAARGRDGGLRRAPTTPTARRATRRWATGSRSAAPTWSCSPATCSCSAPASSRRFRNRIVNVHPALLPAFPGLDAIGQALDAGVEIDRGHRPLRRRGRRHRADHPAARRSPCPPTATGRSSRRRSTRVEHELYPEAIRMIAAGRVRIDADDPRVGRRSMS